MRKIQFSPPDITDLEISEVVDTLKSGWITTGPKTKHFEEEIAKFCHTNRAVCLNSATASLEAILFMLGIGKGDEVITSVYTYTASCSPICHLGATPVFIDTAKDSFEMDYAQLEQAVTPRTKAIIPVDIAGVMCDYDKIFEVVNRKKDLFVASNYLQKAIGKIAVVADSAHGFGSVRNGKVSGSVADFTTFSFHAVKNLTTAEGGALTWKPNDMIDDEKLYEQFMLYSLHGQSKDALSKIQLGNWEYDIKFPGYKCNMTDIMASMGLAQMKRYDKLLDRRRQIVEIYDRELSGLDLQILKHYDEYKRSTGHLYLVRLFGKNLKQRNNLIQKMAEHGIATNVHYKPLPMHTAYKNLGFDIADYPNAFHMYENEITLPLHTLLSDEEVKYICDIFKVCLDQI